MNFFIPHPLLAHMPDKHCSALFRCTAHNSFIGVHMVGQRAFLQNSQCCLSDSRRQGCMRQPFSIRIRNQGTVQQQTVTVNSFFFEHGRNTLIISSCRHHKVDTCLMKSLYRLNIALWQLMVFIQQRAVQITCHKFYHIIPSLSHTFYFTMHSTFFTMKIVLE